METPVAKTIDLDTFQDVCRIAWAQRRKVDALTREVNAESKKLEEMKAKVLAYMEQSGLEKQHIPGYGTLYTISRFTVKVPQGDAKLSFFEYLKGRGIFETLATIHSQTLNSWYSDELDEAVKQGNVDFKIPGIDEAKNSKSLGFKGESA